MFHTLAVKILAGPYVWAIQQDKQTHLTRTLRAAWRAL